ncbi:MAG: ribbon-helix-helix protein, CopG family, partial [Acidimicrobiia bacterium]
MSKVRTTLTIDGDLLKAVKVKAARLGRGDSQVIEDAVRRDLGWEVLDRLWRRNDMGEEESLQLAVEAQHAT